MSTPMMACGHAANARSADGSPSCVICVGIVPGADVIAETPDLSNRLSRCAYCKKSKPSSPELAFFSHQPNREFDDHYDGCRGWD